MFLKAITGAWLRIPLVIKQNRSPGVSLRVGSPRVLYALGSADLKNAMGRRVAEQKTLVVTVDDDASVRKALTRLIKCAGYGVQSFASAEEFLVSSLWLECDCLILDVRMPGLSGLELQCALAEAGHRIPTIFISALADEQTRSQALQGGAVAFFHKPFDEQMLLEAISSALLRS